MVALIVPTILLALSLVLLVRTNLRIRPACARLRSLVDGEARLLVFPADDRQRWIRLGTSIEGGEVGTVGNMRLLRSIEHSLRRTANIVTDSISLKTKDGTPVILPAKTHLRACGRRWIRLPAALGKPIARRLQLETLPPHMSHSLDAGLDEEYPRARFSFEIRGDCGFYILGAAPPEKQDEGPFRSSTYRIPSGQPYDILPIRRDGEGQESPRCVFLPSQRWWRGIVAIGILAIVWYLTADATSWLRGFFEDSPFEAAALLTGMVCGLVLWSVVQIRDDLDTVQFQISELDGSNFPHG